jgi:methyltransferase (TIGR00027 family)
MLNSVKGVRYPVADLPKARAWYEAMLGTKPFFDSPFVVIFVIGDSTLSLVSSEASPPAREPSPVVYWGVDDVDSARARLLSAGATARGEIVTTALKSRAATVADPFGNLLGIAGPPAAARSVAQQPSESAAGVALFRALATWDDRDEIRGADSLAHLFAADNLKPLLARREAREFIKSKVPGSYEFFIARTAWLDGQVAEALNREVPQIVFLGAGYDTRSWRFRGLNKRTRIFELDAAQTQERKRRLLDEAGVAPPDALTFVTVDFTRDDLREVLERAGFDPTAETLYVWEGVTYYLPADAVDRTLAFIRASSLVASVVLFDYLVDAPDMRSRYGVAESEAMMRDTYRGEPVRFGIKEGTIESFLAARGFELLDHLNTEEMERRFLALRDGTPAGRALACFGLVRARVA